MTSFQSTMLKLTSKFNRTGITRALGPQLFRLSRPTGFLHRLNQPLKAYSLSYNGAPNPVKHPQPPNPADRPPHAGSNNFQKLGNGDEADMKAAYKQLLAKVGEANVRDKQELDWVVQNMLTMAKNQGATVELIKEMVDTQRKLVNVQNAMMNTDSWIIACLAGVVGLTVGGIAYDMYAKYYDDEKLQR